MYIAIRKIKNFYSATALIRDRCTQAEKSQPTFKHIWFFQRLKPTLKTKRAFTSPPPPETKNYFK